MSEFAELSFASVLRQTLVAEHCGKIPRRGRIP